MNLIFLAKSFYRNLAATGGAPGLFEDPRNEEWDFMSGHLDALNAAEGDEPGANAFE
jgi:hypothetical protein